jgi:hypothetical protein
MVFFTFMGLQPQEGMGARAGARPSFIILFFRQSWNEKRSCILSIGHADVKYPRGQQKNLLEIFFVLWRAPNAGGVRR